MRKMLSVRARKKEDTIFGNTARKGKREGKGREGKARQGKARQGKARQGKARQGEARQSKARRGKARQSVIGLVGENTCGAAAWTDRRYYLSSPVFLLEQLVQITNLLYCFNEKGKQGR